MSYLIETKICSKNAWYTPAEAEAYYGSYSRHGLTAHWWGGGESADQHDNIVNYFMGQAQSGIKSVNYVVSDNKITKMVEPDNVAWASESGNPVTISVEFQPTLSAEGYRRGGWLISELEKTYGKLELYKHSFWFPTNCPGTIDLNKLRQEADNQGEDEMQSPTSIVWVPNPAKPSEKRMDVFMRGDDSALHQKYYTPNGYTQWINLGYSIASAPSVVSTAPGRLDVYATGSAGDLVHIWFDGKWNVPESLGKP